MYAQSLPNPVKYLSGQQRMASQLEKVIIRTHWLNMKLPFQNLHKLLLDAPLRRTVRCRYLGAGMA
ncbi:hypothetical protein D3C75_1307540 [compost metagenome]